MSETASVNIPKDVLQPIIEAHMTKALVEAMGSQSDVLNAAVRKVLMTTVKSDGTPSTNTYDKPVPFCEYLVAKAFREAATESIKDAVAVYKDQIKKEVTRQLGTSKSKIAKALAEAMATQFEGCATSYRLVVNLDFETIPG